MNYHTSLDRLVLQLHDVLVRHVQALQLVYLLLLYALDQRLLSLPGLLEFLVLDLLQLVSLFAAFLLVDDLLLQLVGVLLQQVLPLLLQLVLDLLQLSLLAHCRLELRLLCLGLLLQSALLLQLLLDTRFLQLLILLGPDFSLDSILFSGSSLIGFNCSLCPQSVQFSLPVRSLFLKLPQTLNLFLFFFLDTPKSQHSYFCSASSSASFSAFSLTYWVIFSSSSFSLILRCYPIKMAFLLAWLISSLIFDCFSRFR